MSARARSLRRQALGARAGGRRPARAPSRAGCHAIQAPAPRGGWTRHPERPPLPPRSQAPPSQARHRRAGRAEENGQTRRSQARAPPAAARGAREASSGSRPRPPSVSLAFCHPHNGQTTGYSDGPRRGTIYPIVPRTCGLRWENPRTLFPFPRLTRCPPTGTPRAAAQPPRTLVGARALPSPPLPALGARCAMTISVVVTWLLCRLNAHSTRKRLLLLPSTAAPRAHAPCR
jgi:hypothetical protein